MTLIELFLLNIYLGLPVYILFTIMMLFVIRKEKVYKIIAVITLFVFFNICASILIWIKWPFAIDVMQSFILLPALISCSITCLFYLIYYFGNRGHFLPRQASKPSAEWPATCVKYTPCTLQFVILCSRGCYFVLDAL